MWYNFGEIAESKWLLFCPLVEQKPFSPLENPLKKKKQTQTKLFN